MNPGKLNHRIRFAQLTAVGDGYGGASASETPVVCSQSEPTDVTWGSLEPIKQWNQFAIEQGASVLNGDRMLVIRYRAAFTPTKDMIFEDLNHPGDTYMVKSVTPYYPGTRSIFQNSQQQVYKDNVFIFILGIKRS